LKATDCPGLDSDIHLHLVWLDGGKMMLKKTGPFFDGDYLIDFNLKNFSNLPSPSLPSDAVSGAYVQKEIKQAISVKFGGIPVHLTGLEYSPVTALKAGSYIVTVSPLQDGHPTATFTISKATQGGTASIVKISSCPASIGEGENLELVWPENSKILLRKNGMFCDGEYVVDFNLKNFSDIATGQFPSDTATKAFVQQLIRDTMDAKFSGIMVALHNNEEVNVTPLKIGSYVVAATPQMPNAPTATWHISKNAQSANAHIVKVSSLPGVDSGENLQLTWAPNAQLRLSKTGPFYDGEYLIDFNLKNFSAVPPPVLPSDTVNASWVQELLDKRLEMKYSGITVSLEGSDTTEVISLKPGSYLITVSPISATGPSATFAISKSGFSEDPSIVKITSCPGHDTKEQLELLWNAGEKLCLRKSGSGNDGLFVVDLNLKNISTNSYSHVGAGEGGLPNVVTESPKEKLIKGIDISLSGNELVPVISVNPGSYMLSISPKVPGGPTCTFSISKSSSDMEPSVVRLTGTKGTDGNEDLVLTWAANDKIRIGKTGNNFDGLYTVDTNMRNLTVMTPETVANDNNIDKNMHIGTVLQYKFWLVGLEETKVAQVAPGTYFAFVSSSEYGLYNATFSLTKIKDQDVPGFTVAMSLNKTFTGTDSETSLEELFLTLRWDSENTLFVSKTTNEFDGVYSLKLM